MNQPETVGDILDAMPLQSMPAPAERGVKIHTEFEQRSGKWFEARCGLLTASEFDRILHLVSAKTVREYRLSGHIPEQLTPKRAEAISKIGDRRGSMKELAFLAGVSDGVLRELLKAGALEQVDTHIPATTKIAEDERQRTHLWEMAAQRITGYIEPGYQSDAMLRGQEDEILAAADYAKHFAPVTHCGLVTNNKWGFTLGCSPDGLVGDDGCIESKSSNQRLHVQRLVEHYESGTPPEEFMLQVQGILLVTERQWCDLLLRCGGLPQKTIRILPDPRIQDAILEAAARFETRISEVIASWGSLLRDDPKLIPTERVEEEMVI